MQDGDLDEEENITLLVKKFGKFLQKDKTIRFGKGRKFFKKNEALKWNQNFTCFECGKQGHMKRIPSLANKSSFKGKTNFKPNKVYIAWDDNKVSSSSDSKNENFENFTLMASHHSNDEH